MNLLDRLLLSHDNDDDIPSIKEFYLTFDEAFDESRVNDWISTVVKRKVEKLKLYIDTSGFTIYPCLFTCGTLTDLEIQMHDDIRFPESISLTSLKILRLENVVFLDEKLMEQLFSNCPVLEKLGFKDCTWMGKIGSFADEQVFFIFPVLQELMFIHTVRQRKFIYDIRISAPVLKSLSFVSTHTNFQGCRININAPSLLSLVYKEALARDYVLNSFGSLVTANIDFMFLTRLLQQNREEMVYAASKLIGMLSSVKLLKMSGYTFMALSLSDDHMIHLPTFYNVVHLKVTKRFSDRTLLDFLQILPNLESLVFGKGFDCCQSNVDDSWTLNVVPQCLLLQLKSVEFRRFNGHPREMNLVKLFLKNARVLQTMFILPNDWTYNVIETVDELLMFPRASPSCVVNFSFD